MQKDKRLTGQIEKVGGFGVVDVSFSLLLCSLIVPSWLVSKVEVCCSLNSGRASYMHVVNYKSYLSNSAMAEQAQWELRFEYVRELLLP